MEKLLNLPEVRGRYTENADLSKTNWFRVGGAAEVLFKPADLADLQHFLKNKPANLPVTVLGVGSNIIVRDGGIEGVVIKLGREFAGISHSGCDIEVGSAALDVNVAAYAAEHGIAGLEFLVGIPGTIGGAVAMNAGAYGKEIKDVLVDATLVNTEGHRETHRNSEMQFAYRKCGVLNGRIVTRALLRGTAGNSTEIFARMNEIKIAREESQPIRSRTGGSTYRNPDGHKAWELIDKAGCRGLTIGGAQVSEKHCNFFINTGSATAADLENLIIEVKRKVMENSGVELVPEIKIIGKKL